MDRKGLELAFDAVIVGFILLGAVALIYFLFFSRVLNVYAIVAEYEADIHNINLAQVLMSSELAYSDGNTVQRGVFDKGKLDAGQLENLDIWYPDAIAVVGIEDLETGEEWKAILSPEKIGGVTVSDVLNCLSDTRNFNVLELIFRVPLFSPWKWPDLVKCTMEGVNEIVPAVRDFPIAIRVSENEVHSGNMRISLRELVFGVVV